MLQFPSGLVYITHRLTEPSLLSASASGRGPCGPQHGGVFPPLVRCSHEARRHRGSHGSTSRSRECVDTLACSQQKRCFAAGRLKDIITRGTHRPVGDVPAQGDRREERPPCLACRRTVDQRHRVLHAAQFSPERSPELTDSQVSPTGRLALQSSQSCPPRARSGGRSGTVTVTRGQTGRHDDLGRSRWRWSLKHP
jgi:hypothetical protein